MKPKLIGITGRKFNGKDTLGNMLISKYDYKRFAFADPLKEGCKHIFGLTDEQLYGDLKETNDDFWQTTPRTILQFVGTELFREQLSTIMPHLGKNIWVEATKRKIMKEWQENNNQCIVVTDVRFENEVNMIKQMGGIVIRIVRDSMNDTVDVHASEIAIQFLDVTSEISNNSSIEDLSKVLDNFMVEL